MSAAKQDLELVSLTKRYGPTVAVDSINHKFKTSSYTCLLGPSGCGKSSTLRMIAGHGAGAHGYLHEIPVAMTPKQEEDVLVKSVELIEKLTGYVAPCWGMSNSAATLSQKYNFSYDHSQGSRDFQPYYESVGDAWTVIDYINNHERCEWMTFDSIAVDVRARFPFEGNTRPEVI